MGDKPKVQGEGNYDAARDYDEGVTKHARDKDAVKREAEAARDALEGSEAGALEKAEREGRSHARH